MDTRRDVRFDLAACALLVLMATLAGGAAWRESVMFDEVAHIGAGVSYLQTLDLRLNEEHPPLSKIAAALPLVLRGTRADYANPSWKVSELFFYAFGGQWVFGDLLLTRWNDPTATLAWARFPMLLITLGLGWMIYLAACRFGGAWGGLLSLSLYVSTPAFLAFGPLVLNDVLVGLFSLATVWALADLWSAPARRTVVMLALALAGALLSKFSAGILLLCFVAFSLSTRWRRVPGQPAAKPEARAWRRLRWRKLLLGVLGAAAVVYGVYFILSWNQSTDVLDRVGSGPAVVGPRRLLMPPWLYLRGLLMMLASSFRPTFLLGRAYSHGVWFYFPVVVLLKSSLGFLLILGLGAVVGLKAWRSEALRAVIPAEARMHWRAVWVSLIVFTAVFVASGFNISVRHFSIPLVLLMIVLAPIPRILARLRSPGSVSARVITAALAVVVLSCLATAIRAYPYYIPYMNALGLGHPVYELLNDSNVDWNQGLPEVRQFAAEHHLATIKLDVYSMADPASVVPGAEIWDCQAPAGADAGTWVGLSANMILESHNCAWLMRYPHQALAGGSFYMVRLPDPIPPAGAEGGPPPLASRRIVFGGYIDMRPIVVDLTRHPEKMPKVMADMEAQFVAQYEAERRKKH